MPVFLDARLSTHSFGIPQVRPRFFIVAAVTARRIRMAEPRSVLSCHCECARQKPGGRCDITAKGLTAQHVAGFLDRSPRETSLSGFPRWSMDWRATYRSRTRRRTALVKAAVDLSRLSRAKDPPDRLGRQAEVLPSYAREKKKHFPDWKVDFIRDNRSSTPRTSPGSILGCRRFLHSAEPPEVRVELQGDDRDCGRR